MAVEMRPSQPSATSRVYSAHITASAMDSVQLSTTRRPNGLPSTRTTKAIAVPSSPGPSGSRVVKKRPSSPRLGDGLGSLCFASKAIHVDSHVLQMVEHLDGTEPLAACNGSGNDDLESDSSDDDDLVVSEAGCPTPRMWSRPRSRGPHEARAAWSDDDSLSSSEDEVVYLRPAATNRNCLSSPESAISQTSTQQIPGDSQPRTARIQHPSGLDILVAASVTPRSQTSAPSLTDGLSISSSNATPDTPRSDVIPSQDPSPSTVALHGIVKGFFTVDTVAQQELVASACTRHSSGTPPRSVFWTQKTLILAVREGTITRERAKYVARRLGFGSALTALELYEARLDATLTTHHALESVSESPATEVPISSPRDSPRYPVVVCRYPTARHQCTLDVDALLAKVSTFGPRDYAEDHVRPLHIFVDMSNIHIGFCDSWKISQSIPLQGQRMRAPAFNFNVLAWVMQRNRPVARKVLAGSVNSMVDRSQWPPHFVDAEAQGYTMNIFQRVRKASAPKAGRRRKRSPGQGNNGLYQSDLTTSGDESAEGPPGIRFGTKNGEQGVDENLHLNMMESVVDCMQEPGTMVLATGDAAKAEFSAGFFQYTLRALALGWKIELVTWKKTISSAWKNPDFQKEYGEMFRIIYLDSFLEELNAGLCT